jgi:hypothetical protein
LRRCETEAVDFFAEISVVNSISPHEVLCETRLVHSIRCPTKKILGVDAGLRSRIVATEALYWWTARIPLVKPTDDSTKPTSGIKPTWERTNMPRSSGKEFAWKQAEGASHLLVPNARYEAAGAEFNIIPLCG